jgi:hypothetical protein
MVIYSRIQRIYDADRIQRIYDSTHLLTLVQVEHVVEPTVDEGLLGLVLLGDALLLALLVAVVKDEERVPIIDSATATVMVQISTGSVWKRANNPHPPALASAETTTSSLQHSPSTEEEHYKPDVGHVLRVHIASVNRASVLVTGAIATGLVVNLALLRINESAEGQVDALVFDVFLGFLFLRQTLEAIRVEIHDDLAVPETHKT